MTSNLYSQAYLFLAAFIAVAEKLTSTKNKPKLKAEILAARRDLKIKGYTQREAAPLLNVSEEHLSYVLNGHRISKSLIRRIHALPENPNAKW